MREFHWIAYFVRFSTCWWCCPFYAIVDTSRAMWSILECCHCSLILRYRALFRMNGTTMNPRNWSHAVVVESKRNSGAFLLLLRLLLFCWFDFGVDTVVNIEKKIYFIYVLLLFCNLFALVRSLDFLWIYFCLT